MTKHRPPGWVNPYPKEGLAWPANIPWIIFHDTLEAGADLMLEKLRMLGLPMEGMTYFSFEHKSGALFEDVPIKNHTMVFIPDDKED